MYLHGNGLPGRWQQRTQFVVLDTAFGTGQKFLTTWAAWRQDAQRCKRLRFMALEQQPLTRAEVEKDHRQSPWPELAAQLAAAWPPLTRNLHVLDFENGRVRLLLALGDRAAVLPNLHLQADAIYLDSPSPPPHDPAPWPLRVLKAVGRKAAPDATLAATTTDLIVQGDLATAGFDLQLSASASPDKPLGRTGEAPAATAMTRAVHRPYRQGGPAPHGTDFSAQRAPRSAIVVGAGLAGAAAAQALARLGLQVTVLEARPVPAGLASGNLAGLFHGTVHAEDNPHARLHRAAALAATGAYAEALRAGVPGQQAGLLRLELRAQGLDMMQTWQQRHRWPADYVQALTAQQASETAGVPLSAPAWFYPGGGWINPPGWVHHALASPGVQVRLNQSVATLQRSAAGWQARGPEGQLLADADVMVLANTQSADQLLQRLGHPGWPLMHTRGQITWRHEQPGFNLRLPLAGDGYVLPLPQHGMDGLDSQMAGGLLCGATSAEGQPNGDQLPAVTDDDHAHNLMRLHRLAGLPPPKAQALLHGRAAWRLNTQDRLPVAGAVARATWPPGQRQDQVRLLPREPGLFVLTALGARGLTLAPLLAQLVAAQACGLPWPLEQDLADAVDPARWRVRAARMVAQRPTDALHAASTGKKAVDGG